TSRAAAMGGRVASRLLTESESESRQQRVANRQRARQNRCNFLITRPASSQPEATTTMTQRLLLPSRRLFLGSLALRAAAFTTRGAFAEELVKTPRQTEGPFYPNKLPLDTDNDLLIVNDSFTPAVGQITHLTGKILDSRGNPIKNALVEIWQCDGK